MQPIKAATGCEFEAASETGRVMQTGSDLGYGATTGDLPWNLDPNILTHKSPCEPNPGTRPDPAGVADEAGPRRNDDARLQTSRHHHAVRSPQHPRWYRHRPQHAASSPPGVHPLPQYDRGAGPCGKSRSTPSSTIMRPTSIQRCANGWRGIPAGHSTSPRPQHPGSTPSKASSPSSRASASSGACSDLLLICRSPSTASSQRQTSIPNPSCGLLTQNASSPPFNGGSKR